MSRTYTFEQFVNMPREEAAAIIEAENKEFHEAVQRACSDGLEVAPHHYGFADDNNLPVPVLAEPKSVSRGDADILRGGPACGIGEAREGTNRKTTVAPESVMTDSRGGQSPWLTGPTTEECSAPVETTEPEVD